MSVSFVKRVCRTTGNSLYISSVLPKKTPGFLSLTCPPLEVPGGEQRFLLEAYQSQRQLSWIGAMFGEMKCRNFQDYGNTNMPMIS